MKSFRKNVAFAFDGGGMRGVIMARALSMLEEALGARLYETLGLAAGTSSGAIIAAALVSGLSAKQITELYVEGGPIVFKKSLRSVLWPLMPYRYRCEPLARLLEQHLGPRNLGELWKPPEAKDLVITTFDLVENRTRFLKPWKEEYKGWSMVEAVLASAAAPTYFPPLKGRFVDGGVGSYGNPCYLAAYEIVFCLGWKLEETTLISLGSGRSSQHLRPAEAEHFLPIHWLTPILDAFERSAEDQQVHLVETFFRGLDFRRFQIPMSQSIAMDDASNIETLLAYGEQLGRMMLADQYDGSMGVRPAHAFRRKTAATR